MATPKKGAKRKGKSGATFPTSGANGGTTNINSSGGGHKGSIPGHNVSSGAKFPTAR